MIEPNQLLQTYIRQYQAASKKKRKTSSRPRDLSERTNRLFKTLKRTKPTQVTSLTLEEWHRQIKNLAYFAYRSHNDAVTKLIETSLLPQLIRLDEAMFLPAQRDDISVDFLNYLETELDGQLCTQTLLELYQIYKRYVIQYKIMDLVPSRPELEFPETMAMNRRFILHIGPTNSGKTFHALERLKTAKKGTYLGPLRLLALEVYEKMHDCGVPSTMLTGQECIADDDSRITASTIEMADFSEEYDIAVIDEAQLTADPDRGHCWTKAILGLKAHEIHVCMSPAAESAVTHLIHLCGDSLAICRYQRKTALICEDTPFSFPESVLPGDALVVFSKKSVLDLDEPLDVIIKVWKSVEPTPPFEKVSVDEILSLYAQAERHRDDIYGFDDKRILYRMISCPIDIKDHQVVLQWLRYCKDYPADKRLKHPDKGAGSKLGLQKYETYYRKLDLYYQFSHRFDKIIDEDWLEQERSRTEGTIMQYLSKGKKSYIARCQRCGRMLPVGYPFKICEPCFHHSSIID